MILPEQGVARKSANQWFDNIGVTPNIYAQVAGNEAIVSMVSLGFGVSIVPKIVLSNSPLKNTVSVVTPPQALAAFNIGLFTLEKKTQKPSYPSFLAT